MGLPLVLEDREKTTPCVIRDLTQTATGPLKCLFRGFSLLVRISDGHCQSIREALTDHLRVWRRQDPPKQLVEKVFLFDLVVIEVDLFPNILHENGQDLGMEVPRDSHMPIGFEELVQVELPGHNEIQQS